MAVLPENAAIYLPSLYPINFYPFLIKSTHAAILLSNMTENFQSKSARTLYIYTNMSTA